MSILLSASLEQLRNAEGRHALRTMNRGIERECLRITAEGRLATTPHPQALGSKLTHPLITTDYAEALLEFITPVETDIETTLAQLRDIHRATYQALGNELLWPLSMPCYLNDVTDIELANYGSSHIGRMKTTYRQGLTHRYGAVMQTISGVHFNWSVSDALWDLLAQRNDTVNNIAFRSQAYFGLLRNFKRWAWVIPYLFGASPVLCKSFLQHSNADLDFRELGGGMVYVPYATSLRMSDLGYTNKEQAALKITYNSLEAYIEGLRNAVFTRSEQFAGIGIREGDHWLQLNDNILQIENEFYSPIRPKRVAESGETPTQALERGGVQYIEVRAVDVNPYSSVGITADQMRFLDLFLLYCLLSESPPLPYEQQRITEQNVNRIVLRGREPGLTLVDESGESSVRERLQFLFGELKEIANLLDQNPKDSVNTQNEGDYQRVLEAFAPTIDDPEQTLSARVLKDYQGAVKAFQQLGLGLANQYKQELLETPFEHYSAEIFAAMAEQSRHEQADIEAADKGSYEDFLAGYFNRALIKKTRLKGA
ncbi:glutamate--cysteine ligase [Aliidiomarina halalkaliphila]|uniref:glutamate--cysteine ligase n=1 Tax=Aliidiomarina halalkaliphila TaxID=2593535 RepID=UPI001E45EF29|nr:glutamate--cysteine ligase [Aliidiomarina halalkaliphila]